MPGCEIIFHVMGNTGASPLISSGNSPREWLVVRTKPRQERAAMSHLRQREVHSYCPMYLEPTWSRRKVGGPVPLFTSYIFVCLAPTVQLNAVAYCPGVAHPVRFGTRLATVGQEVIDALRRRDGQRGYVVPPEIEVGLRLGCKVMIMAGPLAGLEGVFRGYVKGNERARVFLEFLRQKTTVEVETDLLAAARA